MGGGAENEAAAAAALANLPLGLLGLINTQYETQVLLFKALYGLF